MNGVKIKYLRKYVLLAIVAVLAVIVVVQTVMGTKSNIKDLKIETDISKIEITSAGSSVSDVFEKQSDGSWMINGKYLADSGKTQEMLDSLKNIRVLGTVGSSKSDAEKFGLDDGHVIRVKVFGDGKLLRTVRVGKTSGAGAQTYAQVDSSDSFKLVNGNLTRYFGAEINTLRDKMFWKFDPACVTQIKLFNEGKKLELSKEAVESDGSNAYTVSHVWTVTGANFDLGGEIDSAKIDQWVVDLAQVNSFKWKSDDWPMPRNTPEVQLEIYEGEKIHSVSLYYMDEEEHTYLSSSSDCPFMFDISEVNKNRIARNVDSFLKQVEE